MIDIFGPKGKQRKEIGWRETGWVPFRRLTINESLVTGSGVGPPDKITTD